MTALSAQQAPHNRAVRWWLVTVVVLIAIMALVGAATRLTESGLSIVEWKPVTGTLPPLSEAQWTQAFDAYKAIPQYRELNAGMNLSEFKTIFWWEWSHRLLGRVIGVVFLLPFLWFLWRGALSADLKLRLWLIFGLGALQGVVGWWMVASGLSERVEVSHYRLATHLMLALLIFAAIVWTLRRMADEAPLGAPSRLKITSVALLVLTFVQLYLGALLAGLRAGRRSVDSIRGATVLRPAVVAQSVRQLAYRPVRASHGSLCAICAGYPARGRRRSLAGWDHRGQRCTMAGGGDHVAGGLGRSYTAQSGSCPAWIGPSGRRDVCCDAGDLSG
jgi:heme A synthase